MIIAAVVPWRPGHPERGRRHAVVREYLRQLLPDAVHLDADSTHPTFNLAASRNHGVRLAQAHFADVVVLCDADTIVQPAPLAAAITACDDGRLHLPYTRYRALTAAGSASYLAGRPSLTCEADDDHENATGGIVVMTPDAWWRAGGQDPRFTSWGYEDTAFRIAADALLGPTVRHPGTIHHLWHPTSKRLGSPAHLAGAAHMNRYRAADGAPDAVRAIVTEHAPPEMLHV